MTTAITLMLPDQLYEQAKRLAQQRRQVLEMLLIDEIAENILAKTTLEVASASFPLSSESTYEPDEAVEYERAAYIALHPFLKRNFLGKHVAIYQGQLVDSDDEYAALYARIDAAYPDVFVWLDTVAEEAMETITLRSTLFVEN